MKFFKLEESIRYFTVVVDTEDIAPTASTLTDDENLLKVDLHEGKLVDWTESVEGGGSVNKKKSSDWDESLSDDEEYVDGKGYI